MSRSTIVRRTRSNRSSLAVLGQILQDEKYPGVHIAFGNPYGAHTGADWFSSTHIDVVGRKFDIWIDGRQIMHGGEFLLDSLIPPVV